MQNYPTLTNAPIREALIDFRFQLPNDFNFEKFDRAYTNFKKDFPKREALNESLGKFEIGPKGLVSSAASTIKPIGFLYKSKDDLSVVQYKTNGFTYNRLKPYIDWTHLVSQAKLYWSYLQTEIGSGPISRIGLRFINAIPLPAEKFELDDILTEFHGLSDGIDCTITGFLHRTTIRSNSNSNQGHITTTVEKTDASKDRKLIFDIDVFNVGAFLMDGDEIWKTLDSLRELKNSIFFMQLTSEKLKEFA
ncbi:MAG: hypothetical protein JWO30_4995 [Fibrobacteres bacterium]|nr:hypothetical protein [Fibrobacterota bacterium]